MLRAPSGCQPPLRVRVRTTEKETVVADERPEKILAALGGAGNIIDIEGCITRLRCELEDGSVIDEAALKKAGALGVMKMGSVVQVVVGPEADTIAEDIQDLL
ncbi:PTS sugar transporter [Amycolatopsis acidicola]|uniref:PTS sugar transporter n=1 Tax=Amycolatopsis acidicola TaxID=2596893 RepID=A0A5N0UMS6_9PSEU|nr:PTS glucose/sucrose transporter subunit IIB [Amycolatopsis acidicola]KAA9148836.1 PTS sugar transporter [Amycolatopsis acidicola]